MNATQFAKAVRALAVIPADKRKKLLAVAKDLSAADRANIMEHLRGIAGDLGRTEQKHEAAQQRQELMCTQVKQHDMPILNTLLQSR